MIGLAVPYYHKLIGDATDRLILRYEIYMRCYLINLLRIQNPYAFTALGSAMAVTVRAYRKAGGLTPVKSGEDFYFLQNLISSHYKIYSLFFPIRKNSKQKAILSKSHSFKQEFARK